MGICAPYYTIPSDNMELQPIAVKITFKVNYTIPSDNMELQRIRRKELYSLYYTIPVSYTHL